MAKAVRVEVNPEVIKYYIDRSDYETEFLTQNKQFKMLDQWIEGSKKPTFNQLDKLSRKLEIPLGYLIVNKPIDDTPELLNFRTIESKGMEHTSRNLIETIKISKRQQEYVSEYRENNGYTSLEFVDKFTTEDNIQEIIEYSRQLLNISENWQDDLNKLKPFKYFRNKLNNIGIIVQTNGIVGQNTKRVLDINEFRAFVIIDEFAPFIFINTNDTQNGQLFSLLHEFAHVLLGSEDVYNANATLDDNVNPHEVLCNQIASEILVPNEVFINHWEYNEELNLYIYVSDLAKKFKVSKTVIARKALSNQLIKSEQYNQIAEINFEEYKQSEQRKKESDGGGNYYNTLQSKMDSALFNTIKQDYYEGNIQYNEALKVLNVGSKGFNHLDRLHEVNEVDLY